MLTDRANTICLYRILFEHSDENHILSMRNIIDCFAEEYDMKIDRRTVYSSVDTLKDFGYDISAYDENGKGYYLKSRLLSPADVRLLSDALYSLYSVPNKQTAELVGKLQLMLSEHERTNFRHLTAVSYERKTDNSAVFRNISAIDEAIGKKYKVSFVYLQYGLDKKLHPRRLDRYIVSPFGMICENGNYYLICVKDGKEGLSYYRIDRMNDINVLPVKVDSKSVKQDIASSKRMVYAFSGKEENIVLKCSNSVIGGVIDRFGLEPKIRKIDDEHFEARIRAVPRGVLYWTMQYLSEIEILEPESVRQQAIDLIKSNKYGI